MDELEPDIPHPAVQRRHPHAHGSPLMRPVEKGERRLSLGCVAQRERHVDIQVRRYLEIGWGDTVWKPQASRRRVASKAPGLREMSIRCCHPTSARVNPVGDKTPVEIAVAVVAVPVGDEALGAVFHAPGCAVFCGGVPAQLDIECVSISNAGVGEIQKRDRAEPMSQLRPRACRKRVLPEKLEACSMGPTPFGVFSVAGRLVLPNQRCKALILYTILGTFGNRLTCPAGASELPVRCGGKDDYLY